MRLANWQIGNDLNVPQVSHAVFVMLCQSISQTNNKLTALALVAEQLQG